MSSVEAWTDLPRRIYLDTSALQTIFGFGEFLFDNLELNNETVQGVPGLRDELDALCCVLQVNTRAGFQLVVTEGSLAEVMDRGHPRYTDWVLQVMDIWIGQSDAEEFAGPGPEFCDPSFGMISSKDRILLQEALDCRCDAFLTMERRLPATAKFVEQRTGLRILRPTGYWKLLRPWAAMYF